MMDLVIQRIVLDHMLIIFAERFLCNINIICCHGDQFLVIKRNPQRLCQLHTQFSSTAAEFTAHCNHLVHNTFPRLSPW